MQQLEFKSLALKVLYIKPNFTFNYIYTWFPTLKVQVWKQWYFNNHFCSTLLTRAPNSSDVHIYIITTMMNNWWTLKGTVTGFKVGLIYAKKYKLLQRVSQPCHHTIFGILNILLGYQYPTEIRAGIRPQNWYSTEISSGIQQTTASIGGSSHRNT